MDLARVAAAAAAAARRSARSRSLPRVLQGVSGALSGGSPSSLGGNQRRGVSASRLAAAGKKPVTEATEAMLAQQMLDFIRLAEEAEAESEAEGGKEKGEGREDSPLRQDEAVVDAAAQALLPVTGAVMDVKNGLASVSGLRHATIGSVVAIYDVAADDERASASGEPVCRGLVLFLEKKAAHVALLDAQASTARVRIGMHVALESAQLTIPGGIAHLSGAVIDSLGALQPLVLTGDEEEEGDASGVAADSEAAASARIPVAWGPKTVPGLVQRAPLSEPLETGVLAVDCLKPVAFGHRLGVLGPRRSGKTRLALDVVVHQAELAAARQQPPPHVVYVCVGQSAGHAQQIARYLEDRGALRYTTIVAADARASLVAQYLAPFTGCAVAEFFMKHGASRRSIVVYDDLAAHTAVVESLAQTMRLPRAAQLSLSLSAHAVLMERSAQFADGASLTTLALADAPDARSGEVSALQERLASLVDDCIQLDAALANQRVYPAVDVLAPGASIRGPPFQSATLWAFMSALRPRINEAARIKENVEAARKLGFEVEPEDAERLEFLELVQQFFAQTPGEPAVPALEKELGAFLLSELQLSRLPADLALWDMVTDVARALRKKPALADVYQQLARHPRDRPWSADLQENVRTLLSAALDEKRKEQRARQKQLLMGEIKRQQRYGHKLQQKKRK